MAPRTVAQAGVRGLALHDGEVHVIPTTSQYKVNLFVLPRPATATRLFSRHFFSDAGCCFQGFSIQCLY